MLGLTLYRNYLFRGSLQNFSSIPWRLVPFTIMFYNLRCNFFSYYIPQSPAFVGGWLCTVTTYFMVLLKIPSIHWRLVSFTIMLSNLHCNMFFYIPQSTAFVGGWLYSVITYFVVLFNIFPAFVGGWLPYFFLLSLLPPVLISND